MQKEFPPAAVEAGRVIIVPFLFEDDTQTQKKRFQWGGNTVLALSLLDQALSLPSEEGFVIFDLGAGTGVLTHRALKNLRVKRAYMVEENEHLSDFAASALSFNQLYTARGQLYNRTFDEFFSGMLAKVDFHNLNGARPIFIVNEGSKGIDNALQNITGLFRGDYLSKHKPIIVMAGIMYDMQSDSTVPNDADLFTEKDGKAPFDSIVTMNDFGLNLSGKTHHMMIDGNPVGYLGAILARSELRVANRVVERPLSTAPLVFFDGRAKPSQSLVSELRIQIRRGARIVVHDAVPDSPMVGFLKSLKLPRSEMRFTKNSLKGAMRPYLKQPNLQFVLYSGNRVASQVEQAVLDRLKGRAIHVSGETPSGALAVSLDYLSALMLNREVAEIETLGNSQYRVSRRAAQQKLDLYNLQYAMAFAQSA